MNELTPINKYAYDLGAFAQMMEDYNRDVQQLKIDFPEYFTNEQGTDNQKLQVGENINVTKHTNNNI